MELNILLEKKLKLRGKKSQMECDIKEKGAINGTLE